MIFFLIFNIHSLLIYLITYMYNIFNFFIYINALKKPSYIIFFIKRISYANQITSDISMITCSIVLIWELSFKFY